MTVASQRANFIRVPPPDWSGSRRARCSSSRRALYAFGIYTMADSAKPWSQGGSCHETVLFARCLLALAAHRLARSRHPARIRAGRQPRKEDQKRRRFLEHQPQGLCAGAGNRQRSAPHRGPGDRAISRRPEAGLRAHAGSRHARSLSRAGMAQLRHFGAAQILRPDFPADDARRIQEDLEGKSRQALRLARQAARRQAVPDGRQVHRRRRLSVHGAALVAAYRDRLGEMAERQSLCRSRRSAPEGAGGAEGGRAWCSKWTSVNRDGAEDRSFTASVVRHPASDFRRPARS